MTTRLVNFHMQKFCIAEDMNEDKTIDWQDAAVAYRDIINVPYGSEDVKDLVNYRIVMNFGSAVTNPYSVTADNIKKLLWQQTDFRRLLC